MMKAIFDQVSNTCSKYTTNIYSTSFSFGIKALGKELHQPIYNVYGFVRFADEIVDSFHGFNKADLLQRFKEDTIKALDEKISLNPILNSFQETVHKYNIDWELIETFLNSMEMDLEDQDYDDKKYELYILGSAEVVGLMCLKIFVNGDLDMYNQLKPYAMRLGAAFQKVNFLRDANSDFEGLGRTYFPGVNMQAFDEVEKKKIEADILKDFNQALIGIKMLPRSSRGGVYLAYKYYYSLFEKIKALPSSKILDQRTRIPNSLKIAIMFKSALKHKMNLI